ncbi:ATP-binding protein [Herbihabitans rhizosphaerae]|uniref:ATP-binding protein n=1 Tax=Herbihabitans rhizosphaerae TaxID=1872711 RepID=UPI001F5EDDAC|nr:LuxR C-terminal-related transcriptional regulator [Herbihabitans rhizosphaerae]
MSGQPPAVVHGQWTSFVGRREEVAELRRLIGDNRLVMLTGPGGVGKTRLAGQVMDQVMRAFGDGVVFVGLAELRDDALLATLVADRLGLHDQSDRPTLQSVLEFLRERRILLVLDNCEHLVEACAAFAFAVIADCPEVVVLATGRQSLGVAGERILPLAPLEISGDAVNLFVDRARAVAPAFERTADNEADLRRIAERLDGLPLAIELAAARIRSLSPGQIAKRLSSRLTLLTSGARTAPERQQTLRDTIEWSFELCSPAEQAVWAQASVFAGTFDINAAAAVCAGPDVDGDVLDIIDGLLDKSVLQREDGADRVRYRMLETLREYGRERLAERGDEERVARRHRDWFDQLTATADAEWVSPKQVEWAARLRADHANIRAALGWSLAHPGEAGVALRMACRLDEYWAEVRGLSAEAQLWLDRALAAAPADHPNRPFAVTVAALYSMWLTKLDDTDERLTVAAELAAASDDDVLDGYITYVRARESMLRLRAGTAALAGSAAATFRRHGIIRRELPSLLTQGISTAYEGDPEAARRALHRMLSLATHVGAACQQATAYFGLLIVEVRFGGDVDAATRYGQEALRLDLQVGAQAAVTYRIDALAWVADRQGNHLRAATLFGIAATKWDAIGYVPEVAASVPHRKYLKSTREALGDARFDRAFAIGRAMAEDAAIRYALDEHAEDVADPDELSPLSKREVEIAELVAKGMTNRQIATRLVISLRTVDTHVRNTLTKLDFTSRAQIAAWAASRYHRSAG